MIRAGLFRVYDIQPAYYRLPVRQRIAVLAHEAAHIKYGHGWRAALAALWMNADRLAALRHRHELEADAYAASLGFGPALAVVLLTHPEHASRTHPSTAERVAKLRL